MTALLGRNIINFNNASATYDTVAKAQKEAAAHLVQKLREITPHRFTSILDLGTGTGYVPELLLPWYPKASYQLNDISDSMLAVCRQKFGHLPNMTFLQEDMANCIQGNPELIISNFALQWAQSLEIIIHQCVIRAGRSFAFSTLIDGTFKEWETLLQQYAPITLHRYPTYEALLNYCALAPIPHTLHYWTQDIALHFSSPAHFLQYLKKLGAHAAPEVMPVTALKALLKSPQPLVVSYKIFFAIYTKTAS